MIFAVVRWWSWTIDFCWRRPCFAWCHSPHFARTNIGRGPCCWLHLLFSEILTFQPYQYHCTVLLNFASGTWFSCFCLFYSWTFNWRYGSILYCISPSSSCPPISSEPTICQSLPHPGFPSQSGTLQHKCHRRHPPLYSCFFCSPVCIRGSWIAALWILLLVFSCWLAVITRIVVCPL